MIKKEVSFGFHSIEALLEKDPSLIYEIWILKGKNDARVQKILKEAQNYGIFIQFVSLENLEKKALSSHHKGILAISQAPKLLDEKDLAVFLDTVPSPFILILDEVQDPHNLGACLRSADAFGVDCVIIPKDHSAGLSATVKKVSSGASERVPLFQVTNLARTLNVLKKRNIWLYGTDGEAQDSLLDIAFPKSCAIIMGSEGKGLRRLTKETCDYLVRIPILGSIESLNVSVATGICLFYAKTSKTQSN